MGVALDRDGVLQFDQTAFNKKFASAPQDAIRAISNNASSPYIYSGGESGLAGNLAVSAYSLLKTGGTVASMTTSYDDKVKRVATDQSKLDAEMEKLTSRYETQFSSLNAVLANFKSTQTRLSAMLNNNNKSN
jgi:flagellar hook-associated protein 2